MSAQKITKSDTLLREYAEAVAIDKVAIPLVPECGLQRAYQIAFDAKERKNGR